MLETLTLESFTPLVETEFSCLIQEGVTLTLKLTEAVAVGRPPAPPRRAAFSLIFLGPTAPLLPQGTWPLTHPSLGENMPIFLVPIGASEAGVEYQAIFT